MSVAYVRMHNAFRARLSGANGPIYNGVGGEVPKAPGGTKDDGRWLINVPENIRFQATLSNYGVCPWPWAGLACAPVPS